MQHRRGRGLGFFGVIDERFDLSLLAAVADGAPDWQLMMVGPVVKIDPHRCRAEVTSTGWGNSRTKCCRTWLRSGTSA